MTHLRPTKLGFIKALFFFIAFALVFSLSLSLLHSSKADEVKPQALTVTRDLSTTPADVTFLGANQDDHLGGNGSSDTFTNLTRSRPMVAGDFNDDGIQDIAFGAPDADYTPPGVGSVNRPDAGAVYILFGRNAFTPTTVIDTNISALSQPDVKIYGAMGGDNVGFSLAVGDVNGDGNDDLLIGAPGVSFGSGTRTDNGAVYVLLGNSTLVAKTIDLVQSNVINMAIYGEKTGDKLGTSLAVGDIGGSSTVADIVMGAVGSKGPATDRTDAGAAYILFGGTGLVPNPAVTAVQDLSAIPAAVRIFGIDGSLLGSSLAVGNVNATGPGDIILGAPKAARPAPVEAAETGAVYVVYGGANLNPATGTIKNFDIATGDQSSSIYGASANDHLGVSVASGDITGDGTADIAMGAPDADGPTDGRPNGGEVYIVAGNPALAARINVSTATVQVTIYGAAAGDHTGSTVAIGRLNSNGNIDNIPELLVGSPAALLNRGSAHVFYGGPSLIVVAVRDLALDQDDIRVLGQIAGDELGWALAAVDLDNNRGGDLAISAPFSNVGAAETARADAGRVYVLLASNDVVPPVNQAPLVQVVHPNGGETLIGGSAFTIEWTATDQNGDDTIQSYEIRLSIDGGTTYNTIIASNIPGATKTFVWTVTGGLNTNSARIRVIATDSSGATGQDSSNANFTITDPGVSVHLLTPNGGETLQFGQVYRITWEVPAALEAQVKGFDLFLSTDGGVTFNNNPIKADPLTPAIAKDVRLFDWTVPSTLCSSTARVLIIATSFTGARSSDSSDANFSTVGPGPTIDTASIALDETLSRLALRTIAPPIGNEILFTENATIELSSTEAGTTFFTFSKPFKFKKAGRVVITKGTINGQDLNIFFPDGATRILRVTIQPCGVTTLRIRRQGGVFVIAPPPGL